jgi:hypothetical protein
MAVMLITEPMSLFCYRFFDGIKLQWLIVIRGLGRDMAVLRNADLWERVAECERVIDASADPKRREMLTHLRTLWVNLAREGPQLDGAAVEEQITTLARIHSDLTRAAMAGAASDRADA